MKGNLLRFALKFIGPTVIYLTIAPAHAQPHNVWEVASYPDAAGYKRRITGVVYRLSEQAYTHSMKTIVCPDTKLSFRSWAAPGEEVISPFTGRRFVNPRTEISYFQTGSRDSLGRITSFMGDPLNYTLPPVTARLLINPGDAALKGFLGIPANIRQQYHFACKNWARFYPLLHPVMSEEWKNEFMDGVAAYTEKNNWGNDGKSKGLLTLPHSLPGQPGHFLGGNPVDGGTENHKMMWRTSCLVYSKYLPKGSFISGIERDSAGSLALGFLKDYLYNVLRAGNGEYDSPIYYPHSMSGLFNVYDFVKEGEGKEISKAILDYQVLTYGLKTLNGQIAGAQKRGYANSSGPDHMQQILWSWTQTNTALKPDATINTPIQHATTDYRPNGVITNILKKDIALPFEAEIAHPSYYNESERESFEYFYCDKDYAMGSVYLTRILNPTQQVVWTLNVPYDLGNHVFTGGQPMFNHNNGHSWYTQTMQKENTLIVLTRAAMPQGYDTWMTPHAKIHDQVVEKDRNLSIPDASYFSSTQAVDRYLKNSKWSASTHFYIPDGIADRGELEGYRIYDAENVYIALKSLTKTFATAELKEPLECEYDEEGHTKFKKGHGFEGKVLISWGHYSGYVLEVISKSECSNLQMLKNKLSKTKLNTSGLSGKGTVEYTSSSGHNLHMVYNTNGLHALGKIDGKNLDFANWADGGVYYSPFVKIKNGTMEVGDGKQTYKMSFDGGDLPVYR